MRRLSRRWAVLTLGFGMALVLVGVIPGIPTGVVWGADALGFAYCVLLILTVRGKRP